MYKRVLFLLICSCFAFATWAEQIHISNPKSWTGAALAPYVGELVTFDVPMFMPYASGNSLSPCCITNGNSSCMVTLSGAPSRSRARTFSRDLQARVVQSGKSYSLEYVSGSFDGNTRATLKKGLDSLQINARGKASLLICASNLEYYMVKNLGTGYGPDNQKQHDAQRAKVRQALALINADIYGFCEIEQGTAALQEICTDLNAAHPNRYYVYVKNNTSSAAGSYTMTAFAYDTMSVKPIGKCEESQTGVRNRKYMQYFVEKKSQEGFIFSINHFKAKTGGSDTEQTRIAEAKSVNSTYDTYKAYCHEEDLLIMGDLNAYANEQPVTILLQGGERTDLHALFHPEGSYSYLYAGQADYLDHAIVNASLLPYVTGMQAFHVNSDESDCYTYDGSCNDGSMFRYSDHDPIVVGLQLTGTSSSDLMVINQGENLNVQNGKGGYVRIYDMRGCLLYEHALDTDDYTVFSETDVPMMRQGCYVVHVFFNGVNKVTKYIRP